MKDDEFFRMPCEFSSEQDDGHVDATSQFRPLTLGTFWHVFTGVRDCHLLRCHFDRLLSLGDLDVLKRVMMDACLVGSSQLRTHASQAGYSEH